MKIKSCPPDPLGKKAAGGHRRTLLMAKLTAIFLLCFCLKVTATSGQQVTLNVKNASLESVLREIKKQTGYNFLYKDEVLEKAVKVTVSLKNASLQEALEACFKNQPLTYQVEGKGITIKEKALGQSKLPTATPNIDVSGKITDTTSRPLPGATVRLKSGRASTIAQSDGSYELKNVRSEDIIVFSMVGFLTKEVPVSSITNGQLDLVLKSAPVTLEEVGVISTGYQRLPRERVTGSFVQLDNELVNRRTSTNILERIDGLAPGVYNNGFAGITGIATNPVNKNTGITIRGESTINSSTEPLIILDNFPYEGQVSNINPNDVESISILKDAAAASIWGARSGNGVIVITTKKGKNNQPMKIDFNANVTLLDKPDLFYSRNFLDAKSYLEVEKYLFDKGYFDPIISDNTYYPSVSAGVELLAKIKVATNPAEKAALQSQLDALGNRDVRNDYNRYVYQKGINQQYSLGFRGGSRNMAYQFSLGRDDNRDNLIRNGFSRTTFNSFNTFTPIKNLEITAGLNYSQSKTVLDNAFGFGAFSESGYPYGNIIPYTSLADANGNALPVIHGLRESYIQSLSAKGFLDWRYRPLDEIALADNATKVSDVLLRLGLKYQLRPGLSAQVNYQNERQMIRGRNLHTQDSYYTRNLINQFSVSDPSTGAMTYNFPLGSILDLSSYDWYVNNLRGQLDYHKSFRQHSITAIAGAEVREFRTEGFIRNSYGYDDQFGTAAGNLNYQSYLPINPAGSASLPSPDGSVTGALNRYVSYYANGGYTYLEKYYVNLSARRDGANLFGAKTNDKITPLWSAGLGWNIGREDFYKVTWLPYLKLRATYGLNGNTYQNGSAYLIGYYFNDSSTGAKTITNTSAPNPQLRWEKVRNINIGIDFATKGSILHGSIELFEKDGRDLIQPTILAPQTGFTTYQANTAKTRTRGIDLTLQSENLRGAFKWQSTLLMTAMSDKVLQYDALRNSGSITTPGQVAGRSVRGLFTYKWAGLDPLTGDPQGYLNGKVSKDYSAIINNFNPDSLVYKGNLTPTVYGALRNDFRYRGFSLSINIVYQLGFVFKRSSTSVNYTDILQYGQNQDYILRWQKPGDEQHTSVPSLVYPADNNRNTFYQRSEALVESGDNIRLQDLRLGYDLPQTIAARLKASHIGLYLYANNLGIIWRKNKLGIDPTAIGNGLASYPNPFTLSFGLNANF